MDGTHLLPFTTEHGVDVQSSIEVQLGDAFEALLEMGLDTQGVLGLWQDLKHLVVWQEEKPTGTEDREYSGLSL